MGTFILPGKPQTYKPPRFFRGRVYAPHKHEMKNARKILSEQASVQRPGAPPLRRAVAVHVTLEFKRPKSHWSKNDPATGQLKSSASWHVVKKPDVDNCLKFVLDAPTLLAQHAAQHHRRRLFRHGRKGQETLEFDPARADTD